MINLQVDALPLNVLATELGATEEQVRKALRSTVNKLAAWLRTRAARTLSAELRIKQNVLRYRLKKMKPKVGPGGTIGGLWIGLNDLDLKYLGAKQDSTGVTARGQSFKQAFLGPRPGTKARKLNGHAFRRTGTSRLPIDKVELPIQSEAEKALESAVLEFRAFEVQFYKTFEHEIKWRTR